MAKDLNAGQKIELSDGSSVTVKKKLGEGGQGAVYVVENSSGEKYALKWYTASFLINNDDFYHNLREIVQRNPPADNFIWPKKLAIKQLGSYGYVMDLRPDGYNELGDFFRVSLHPEARFPNRQVQINAALSVVNAFRRLHAVGLCYKDLNDGNFFINPRNGKVLICDNDNVTANNVKGVIGGKARYMAAEVVEGQAPNIQSDIFSLAIILYRIFMIDHPFEGQNTLKRCLTEDMQKKVYGKEMVFCFDPTVDINRPDRKNHTNSIYNWSVIPKEMREIFVKALGRKAVVYPGERVSELEWKKLLLKMRASILCCPTGKHDLIADVTTEQCPRCNAPMKISGTPAIRFADFDYLITPGKIFFINDELKYKGKGVVYEHNGVKEIALKNYSGSTWLLTTPSGRPKDIKDGEMFPLRSGMEILFDATTRYKIIIK